MAEFDPKDAPQGMIALCRTDDVPDEGGLRIEPEGLEALAVFRSGDEYFVTDDECTHGNASLCDGEVIGEEIECPFHRGTFNLRTGEPTSSPCTIALRTYRSEVHDGVVYAAIAPPGTR
ncbi:MAG TPA: non-heme iron oxygenase ferredoxin subunit [Rhizomicrobium sp.]